MALEKINALRLPSKKVCQSSRNLYDTLFHENPDITTFVIAPTKLKDLQWILDTLFSNRTITHLIIELSSVYQLTGANSRSLNCLSEINKHKARFPNLTVISFFCADSFTPENKATVLTLDAAKKIIDKELIERLEVSALISSNITIISRIRATVPAEETRREAEAVRILSWLSSSCTVGNGKKRIEEGIYPVPDAASGTVGDRKRPREQSFALEAEVIYPPYKQWCLFASDAKKENEDSHLSQDPSQSPSC